MVASLKMKSQLPPLSGIKVSLYKRISSVKSSAAFIIVMCHSKWKSFDRHGDGKDVAAKKTTTLFKKILNIA